MQRLSDKRDSKARLAEASPHSELSVSRLETPVSDRSRPRSKNSVSRQSNAGSRVSERTPSRDVIDSPGPSVSQVSSRATSRRSTSSEAIFRLFSSELANWGAHMRGEMTKMREEVSGEMSKIKEDMSLDVCTTCKTCNLFFHTPC